MGLFDNQTKSWPILRQDYAIYMCVVNIAVAQWTTIDFGLNIYFCARNTETKQLDVPDRFSFFNNVSLDVIENQAEVYK